MNDKTMKRVYIKPETVMFTTLETNIMVTSIGIHTNAEAGTSQLVKDDSWDIWGSDED